MKFYISAKWNLKDTVRILQGYLISKGHEISLDWTKRAFSRKYDKFEESGKFAEEVEAILDSDIFIHLSGKKGKGKYVDLGIALANKKLKGKPLIYVIGKENNESQFYFHKEVNRIKTNNLLEGLKEILQNFKNN